MTAQPLFELWVYLAATPLAGLTLTLVAYAVAWQCYLRSGMHPAVNPVLISVALIVTALWVSDTRYQTYFDGAQFVVPIVSTHAGPPTTHPGVAPYVSSTTQLRLCLVIGVPLMNSRGWHSSGSSSGTPSQSGS